MLSDEQTQRLKDLNRVFLEENAKLNLSALRTEHLSWMGNVMDSVAIVESGLGEVKSNTQVLDIGTGGGFPLLPLAICLPHIQYTGLDSTQKKIDAIQRIIDALDISNVQLICGRTEELGRNTTYREQYDIVTARAVAPLNVLLEFASPFVKPGGKILAWKSMNIDQELQESLLARAELSCQLVDTYTYNLDDWLPNDSNQDSQGAGWGKRQILIFEKRHTLDKKYPRDVGVPKKNPLI